MFRGQIGPEIGFLSGTEFLQLVTAKHYPIGRESIASNFVSIVPVLVRIEGYRVYHGEPLFEERK